MTNPDPITLSLNRLLKNLGSDKSRRAYQDDWSRYRAWLATQNVDVTEARPRHVEDHLTYLQETGCTRSTCGRALSVIRSVYGVLIRDEVLAANPAREVKNPKFDSTPKTPYLNEEQVKRLLEHRGNSWKERRDHLCLCLLFGLGWRRAEVARMRIEDFKDGTVTGIVKGGKRLTVGVPAWLLAHIEAWKAFAGLTTGPLLPRSVKDSTDISGDIVYKIVSNAVHKAGLAKGVVTPHGLRRTNITIGGERGISLKERQLSVGHSSQNTTERYDRARDAAKNAPGQVFEDLIPAK